ncbi:MAG: acetyl-CoA acetyltransferase [Pseudomonadota bacterium]
MTAHFSDRTPILVGAGQCVVRELQAPEEVKSPVDLAAQALRFALQDTGSTQVAAAIDTLVALRTFIDSAAALEHPFGSSSKPPASIAQRLGLAPTLLIYGEEGGQSPQRFVNECAEAIYRGEQSVVAICGAEATAAMKTALKHGWSLDWAEDPIGDMDDRGFQPLFTDVERNHQITFPPQVYAALENAWRYHHGLSVQEHQRLMADLFSPFSHVAADNPYAQFPVARSANFLAITSDDNYALNVPYGKWLVAQDAVNQGAAVVMTSVGRARELGIRESQWVFLHGYADASDRPVSEREDLTRSVAMNAAYHQALAMAELSVEKVDLFDIYSCFPVAVLAACDVLDIDWRGSTPLTVTGGLPYFGGPGNSYSLHAIAEMHGQLRAQPGLFGLVGANGGYLSKHAVGVYSTSPRGDWAPRTGNDAQREVDRSPQMVVQFPFDGEADIETYSVIFKRSEPVIGFAMCRDVETGHRVLSKVERGDTATLQKLLAREPIGRRVAVTTNERGAYLRFVDEAG